MREIKFRAWDKIDGKMQKVNLMNTYDGSAIGQTLYFLEETSDNNGYRNLSDCELMQYTGLKDKNGNEIYEGDIIQLTDDTGSLIKVICEFGTARRDIHGNTVDITGFYFKRLYDNKKTFPIVYNYAGKHDLELFEVIGNIYDNPELKEMNA